MQKDDFSKLDETDHMFRWIFPEPHSDIRELLESILKNRSPSQVLSVVSVASGPQWLLSTMPIEDKPDKQKLVAAAFAFEVELSVRLAEKVMKTLPGVFSFALSGFGKPSSERHCQSWFDGDTKLEDFRARRELEDRFQVIKSK